MLECNIPRIRIYSNVNPFYILKISREPSSQMVEKNNFLILENALKFVEKLILCDRPYMLRYGWL